MVYINNAKHCIGLKRKRIHFSKYIFLCSTKEMNKNRFGKTFYFVNDVHVNEVIAQIMACMNCPKIQVWSFFIWSILYKDLHGKDHLRTAWIRNSTVVFTLL